MRMSIDDAKIIDLPKFLDVRGNLSFVEQFDQVPFEIRRVYWLYDVPGGVSRGGHAEINNEELVIAMSGSFDIVLNDGVRTRTFTLNRSYYGLYIPKGLWREIRDFSTNAVALEFGSIPYSQDDYIRDYAAFCEYAKQPHKTNCIAPLIVKPSVQKQKYSVTDCSLIELDKHHSDRRGNLTVIENGGSFPFDTKRVYYIYDVPGGESRGAHAHKSLEQMIVAVSGSFRVTLDDGENKRDFFLNRPYQGLYIKPGMWRDLGDFSSGAVCMVLASEPYRTEDYIRDYTAFLDFRKHL